jgi:hypothetical protein
LYVTYYGRWLTTRGEMSPWSPGVSKIIGETQLSLGECGFAHMFEKTGFIDALPEGATQGVAQFEAKDLPLLEGDLMANEMAALMDEGSRMLEGAAAKLLEAA